MTNLTKTADGRWIAAPVVNWNGTARNDLRAACVTAWDAVNDTVKALAQCAPHGRDYQTLTDDTYAMAVIQHRARLAALRTIMSDMEALAFHLDQK